MDEKEINEHLAKYVNQMEYSLQMLAHNHLDVMKHLVSALRELSSVPQATFAVQKSSKELLSTLEGYVYQTSKVANNLQRNTKKMKELTSANIPWEIHSKESWTEWRICKVEKEN